MKTKDLVLVSLFTALMVVGAFVKIAFPLIPFSLQAFFCAFAGILLGARLGALSQLVYILIGLLGLPVFTLGGSIWYIFKPSFGFLLGFIACAYVIGKISASFGEIKLPNALLSVFSGLAVLNVIGLSYMYLILRFYTGKADTTLSYVISAGFLPFILKDAILYVVVAIVATAVVPVLKKANLVSGS